MPFIKDIPARPLNIDRAVKISKSPSCYSEGAWLIQLFCCYLIIILKLILSAMINRIVGRLFKLSNTHMLKCFSSSDNFKKGDRGNKGKFFGKKDKQI